MFCFATCFASCFASFSVAPEVWRSRLDFWFSLFGVWYLNVQESDVCHSAFLSYFISETLEHINFEVLG
jgi:hypothetical protein